MLKQSEQQYAFHSDDCQQIDRARKEAEALFRPKAKLVKTSTLADPSPANVSVRKPRILRASVPPLDREMAKIRNSSEPQTAVSASQFAHTERERLNRTRAAIFKQHRLAVFPFFNSRIEFKTQVAAFGSLLLYDFVVATTSFLQTKINAGGRALQDDAKG